MNEEEKMKNNRINAEKIMEDDGKSDKMGEVLHFSSIHVPIKFN